MKLFNIVSTAALFGAVFSLITAQTAKANVADDLNTNYNKIIQNCGSQDSPAFQCSGNLIRFTGYSKSYNAWDPSPSAVTRGGVSFIFIRKDVALNTLFQGKTTGVIYYPSMLKPSWKGNAEVICSFPTDGFIDERPDSCGSTKAYPTTSQRCQEQGITTADAWYTHFTSIENVGTNRLLNSCGFDMSSGAKNIADAFNENLKANKKVGNSLTFYQYTESVIKPWPVINKQTVNPEKLPIQAFFYFVTANNNGLDDARHIQQAYFDETKTVVPIVKINRNTSSDIIFSYKDEDQQVTVADQLNANYNTTVENCGSIANPSFQCSGVLFSQNAYSSNYHVWDPSPQSIQYGGVSFAYLRKDLKFKNFLHADRKSGLIYYPSQRVPVGLNIPSVSCIFPTGGITNSRPDGRCGASIYYAQNSVECQKQDIYTADQWYKHFSDISIPKGNVFFHQCAFNTSNTNYNIATSFSEALKAHNMVYDTQGGASEYGTNEIVVRTQATDANGQTTHPEILPLQAFYYQNTDGLTEAQAYQQDYYNTTGKIVPVVYMNTTDFNNILFEYKTTDQVDLKKTDIAQELTNNYDKVVDNCGSEDSPAFVCSGNIIRFTNYSAQYHVWDPSPAAATRKGISFMYIRQDIPLDKAFKDKASGLIYYPTKMMPVSKEVSSVRCAFPVDGYSDRRYTDGQNDSCGTNVNYPNDSQPCQEQGVTTADLWYKHFSSIPDVDKDRLNHQCGFSLSSNALNQATIFKAALDGQKLLQADRGSASYNELILSIPSYNTAYQIENPKALPIEVFFYTNEIGLTEARGYQQDYHDTVGVDVPVVKLDLNITSGQVAYSYNKADQTDVYNQNH